MLNFAALPSQSYLRGEHSIYYEDLYRLICWLPKYKDASRNSSIYRADLYHRERRTHQKRQGSVDNSDTRMRRAGTTDSGMTPLTPTATRRSSFHRFPSHLSLNMFADSNQPAPAVPLLPAQNPPPVKIIEDYMPFLTLFRSMYKFFTRKVDEIQERPSRRKRRITPQDSGENLPLDIVIFISSFVSRLQQRKIMVWRPRYVHDRYKN